MDETSIKKDDSGAEPLIKILLIVTAVIEAPLGLGLLLAPRLVVSTLLNTPLDTPGGIVAARLAGAAIVSLAICCWRARDSDGERSAVGIVTAMAFYNFAAAAILVYGGMQLGISSIFVWPVIILHTLLGLWCASVVWQLIHRR